MLSEKGKISPFDTIKKEQIMQNTSKNLFKPELETTQTTFSKIEFNKHDLFFRSIPNIVSFDKVKIKNTGTTCIYFKWQKLIKPFHLNEKKSDGIDRFFCHYADSKLFPEEEKDFVFSFFSEKNGTFAEDWILVTNPPLKNCNLTLHLNGMCMLIVDKYSESIKHLDKSLSRNSIRTMINELVLDLISTIKEDDPPLPDLSQPEIFKYYFNLYNKEYNVEYSNFIKKQFEHFLFEIRSLIDNNIDSFWNGSINKLKEFIKAIQDEEKRNEMNFKLDCLIHMSAKKQPEDSNMFSYIRNSLSQFCLEIRDISNAIREELLIPPFNFDYLTRQSLTEQELNKYNIEQNKRRDEFYKKNKRKPPKNNEEEEKELNEYRIRFYENVKEKLLGKFKNIENDKIKQSLQDSILNGNRLEDDYIDRLARVKTIRSVKNEGLEGKSVVLRIDITDYTPIYEDILNEEGLKIGSNLKAIQFPNAKETILQSMNFLLDNRVKVVLLIADFGPKIGNYFPDFSMKYFIEYLLKENLIDQQVYLISNILDLKDFEQKLENDEYKDNSLVVLENINFCPEECGLEFDNFGNSVTLKYYTKFKFTEMLSRGGIYINDSHLSITKKYPTILNMQCPTRALGLRLETQMNKLTFFLSINTTKYMLIIGDNSIDDQHSLHTGNRTMIKNLLTMNCLINKFKVIFVLGKLAIHFIHLIQRDYTIDPKYTIDPFYYNLMKYILIKASINNVEIVFPEDCRILKRSEYQKFLNQLNKTNSTNTMLTYKNLKTQVTNLNLSVGKSEIFNEINDEAQAHRLLAETDYMKYVKTLFKREKIQKELENNIFDEDELMEHPDYQKNKLNDEEKEIITYYKESCVEFKSNYYTKIFVDAQEIKRPQKIFKSELEMKYYDEYLYNKPIVFSSSSSNPISQNQSMNLDTLTLNVHNESNHGDHPGGGLNSHSTSLINIKSTSRHIFDLDEYELVDYGEKTYNKLCSYFKHMHCVMWIGKLSPSIVENLYDNYTKIIKSVAERKSFLREKFSELMAEEEKKLHESDLKAKKLLFNVFMKGKQSYDLIRSNYRYILYQAQGNLNEDEEENLQEDDQFNYEMNLLVDHYLNEEFEFIDNLLSGEQIPGFYGLSEEEKKAKEEELDLKFLEEI